MEIEVTDDGPGHPHRAAAASSCPSTPPSRRGPASALAICQRIVKNHGAASRCRAGSGRARASWCASRPSVPEHGPAGAGASPSDGTPGPGRGHSPATGSRAVPAAADPGGRFAKFAGQSLRRLGPLAPGHQNRAWTGANRGARVACGLLPSPSVCDWPRPFSAYGVMWVLGVRDGRRAACPLGIPRAVGRRRPSPTSPGIAELLHPAGSSSSSTPAGRWPTGRQRPEQRSRRSRTRTGTRPSPMPFPTEAAGRTTPSASKFCIGRSARSPRRCPPTAHRHGAGRIQRYYHHRAGELLHRLQLRPPRLRRTPAGAVPGGCFPPSTT